MTSLTRIGWGGTTLKQIVGSPKIKKTSAGPEVTETFSVNYASAEAAIAARGLTFGDACPIAGGIYAAALLDEIQINKGEPSIARVAYIWKVPDAEQPNPPVGTLTLEADSNVIEVPIGKHPNASPGTNYDEIKKIGKGDWEGIESFLSPQPVFTRTEIIGSFTFSEANVIENVGKRFTGAQMNSEGLTAASDDKWLKMSLAVATSGSNFQKKENWQFYEPGWNEDIYDSWS